ncbi:MAG: imidazole glycerol phosphate synthase subunit HisH [Candidatus Omnitrophica bacterium]|nr:imidazole glycerol phosphate synthase subunit HisH [Candidatus Omnitrophota bacterium]
MIAVIDYGVGNLGSVSNAIKYLGGPAKITNRPADLKKADKIVLPGVGAFKDALDSMNELGLIEPLKEEISKGKIYLGICLGLEVLFEKSEEGDGGSEGLGIIKGDVVKFRGRGLKVPHMGWNQVKTERQGCPLFKGISDGSFFYFVHSYYVEPVHGGIKAATTDYGLNFTSMVWKENIFATQFHPEKSQTVGLKFLLNFLKI